MSDEMGTFRVDIEVENPARPGQRRTVRAVLVDTGAELSWIPTEVLESLGVERRRQWRLRQADGSVIERWSSVVEIHVAGKGAGDEVVFGEPGDLVLLGARTLEGLNFRVDPFLKQLVDAGPAPAAATADTENDSSDTESDSSDPESDSSCPALRAEALGMTAASPQ